MKLAGTDSYLLSIMVVNLRVLLCPRIYEMTLNRFSIGSKVFGWAGFPGGPLGVPIGIMAMGYGGREMQPSVVVWTSCG
jgi:hypothetical protein